MAGVKGRSGGARPGAGRKKKVATVLVPAAPKFGKVEKPSLSLPTPDPVSVEGIGQNGFDPRPALEQVALGLLAPSPAQLKALVALMPYVYSKRGEGGKKDQKQAEAEKVASRFAPAKPPRLVVAGGRKV